MKRAIFVCNTVYQVMVASWLRITEFKDYIADIIVTDHMNNHEMIARRIGETDYFANVYPVKRKKYDYSGTADYSINARIRRGMRPEDELSSMIKLEHKYDVMLDANIDVFSRKLFNVLKNSRFSNVGKRTLKLYLYEDGIYTYSKAYEQVYMHDCIPDNATYKLKILNNYLLNTKCIYGNVKGMFLFNPEMIRYTPEWKLKEIKKIERDNNSFKEYLNYIFSYYESADVYDKKVIFLEESIYMNSTERPDAEMLDKISEIIGKDNIMVKIHPRNPQNVFSQRGYKTNANTAIPWELILFNNDFSNKILITLASSAILNPTAIFGIKVKSYSLYECLKEKPWTGDMWGNLWDCIKYQYEHYDNIEICDDLKCVIEEIKEEIINED